jgi:hypothetical protein
MELSFSFRPGSPAATPVPLLAKPQSTQSTASRLIFGDAFRATAPAPSASAQQVVAAAAPLAEAETGPSLLGRVGLAQNRYLANQQVLGAVTQMLGERFSLLGEHVRGLLRGDDGEV